MSTPTPPTPLDPIVEAEVERAISPYVGLLPPEVLKTMREVLEDALTTHPVAMKLIDHLRERVAPDASGTIPKEGAEPRRDEKAKAGGDEGAS